MQRLKYIKDIDQWDKIKTILLTEYSHEEAFLLTGITNLLKDIPSDFLKEKISKEVWQVSNFKKFFIL